MNSDQYDVAGVLVSAPVLIGIAVLVLVFFPVIAAIVAPDGRRGTFFFLTLFILPGPFGVACAAIASPREWRTHETVGERLREFGSTFSTANPYSTAARTPPPPEDGERLFS